MPSGSQLAKALRLGAAVVALTASAGLAQDAIKIGVLEDQSGDFAAATMV